MTHLDIVNNRLTPNATEPHVVDASYSHRDNSYTLYATNRNPHVGCLPMSAFMLGLTEAKMRVTAPDMDDGFGSRVFLYPEDVVSTWASKKVDRPIKWTAEHSKSFLTDTHGRDHTTHVGLVLNVQGNFLVIYVHTTVNMGAYLSTSASSVPTVLHTTLLVGQYRTPTVYTEMKAMFTNTAPVDAYRDAGRPEVTYVVERPIETATYELQIDSARLRRRNFIRMSPYATPVGLTCDMGDYEPYLDHAIELVDVESFVTQRDASRTKG